MDLRFLLEALKANDKQPEYGMKPDTPRGLWSGPVDWFFLKLQNTLGLGSYTVYSSTYAGWGYRDFFGQYWSPEDEYWTKALELLDEFAMQFGLEKIEVDSSRVVYRVSTKRETLSAQRMNGGFRVQAAFIPLGTLDPKKKEIK